VNDFSVEVRQDVGGRTVVLPRGELDLATHQEFAEAISEVFTSGHAQLVVDLTDTTFVDSTALGTLVSARRRAHSMGGSLTIRCGDERLLRLFQVTSLDKVFAIEAP
jgi:anti-sigma B factor antagonist